MSQNTQSQQSSKHRKNPVRLSVTEKKAIVAQFEEGATQKFLSEQFGVSIGAIQEWINKYASEAYFARRRKPREFQEISPIVRAILEGRLTVKDAASQYQVHITSVRKWIQQYKQQEADMLQSAPPAAVQPAETDTERKLHEELEAARWKIRALETMIEVAETELKIPIRKKPGAKQ